MLLKKYLITSQYSFMTIVSFNGVKSPVDFWLPKTSQISLFWDPYWIICYPTPIIEMLVRSSSVHHELIHKEMWNTTTLRWRPMKIWRLCRERIIVDKQRDQSILMWQLLDMLTILSGCWNVQNHIVPSKFYHSLSFC